MLSSDNANGFISGRVTGVTGAGITPAITVSNGLNSTTANTGTGNYLLPLTPGVYNITANPGNVVSNYISVSSPAVTVNLGQVTSNLNFTLSQGGQIRGFVTRDGINPLPGVAVVALDSNGIQRDQEVSGSDGRFLLVNLSTGSYEVEPILGSGEMSTPSSSSGTVSAGSTLFIGTFTVTGALGRITGSLTANGGPVPTGALIIASTTTVSMPPPSLSSMTLTGAAYYMTASYESSTYALDVRGSTTSTYNVYAFYTTVTGAGVTVSTRSVSGVSVVAGQSTTGINFAW
jgi:hypothetical protein